MQYENNYLKNVIFRIDFLNSLDEGKKHIDGFYNLIKDVFPKKEKIEQIVIHAQVVTQKNRHKVSQSTEKVTNYKFSDKNQEKILMLEPKSNINISFKTYKNSKKIKRNRWLGHRRCN